MVIIENRSGSSLTVKEKLKELHVVFLDNSLIFTTEACKHPKRIISKVVSEHLHLTGRMVQEMKESSLPI
jgi:thiamine kinase-like enzyme